VSPARGQPRGSGIRRGRGNCGSRTALADVLPELARHAVAGQLPVGRFIEVRIGLDDLAPAFEALRRGDRARRVVVFDHPG
jgi:Zn-dependent alcohol dehydrogenase